MTRIVDAISARDASNGGSSHVTEKSFPRAGFTLIPGRSSEASNHQAAAAAESWQAKAGTGVALKSEIGANLRGFPDADGTTLGESSGELPPRPGSRMGNHWPATNFCGLEKRSSRRAHNAKTAGLSPAPATTLLCHSRILPKGELITLNTCGIATTTTIQSTEGNRSSVPRRPGSLLATCAKDAGRLNPRSTIQITKGQTSLSGFAGAATDCSTLESVELLHPLPNFQRLRWGSAPSDLAEVPSSGLGQTDSQRTLEATFPSLASSGHSQRRPDPSRPTKERQVPRQHKATRADRAASDGVEVHPRGLRTSRASFHQNEAWCLPGDG